MKPFVPFPLVLCLLTPLTTLGAKDPPASQNVTSSRRSGATASQKRIGTAATRKANSGDGAAQGRARPQEAGTLGDSDEKAKSARLPPAVSSVQTHRVKRGETLEHIASRYDTTGSVLSSLNGLESGESIREGQFLFVPRQHKSVPAQTPSSNAVWRRYAKPPKVNGQVDLRTHTARFVGMALEKNGRLRTEAVRAINGLLGAGGKHPPLPERLIRLLVKVSDTFGGRPIHLVSGYRTNSYYEDSRHRLSAAIDFAIADVPNAVLCEYLRELDDVGVGYYPNSTFVHLDVRNHSAYWVDYAGPGEPPRSSPNAPRRSRVSKRMLLAELKALVDQTKQAIEGAGSESSPDLPSPSPPSLEPPASEPESPRVHGASVGALRPPSGPVSL